VDLTPESDLNVAIVSEKPISLEEMVAVEKAFFESNLPFRIDIVDWAKLPENMERKY
jgi:predicted nucleotidyltransferase